MMGGSDYCCRKWVLTMVGRVLSHYKAFEMLDEYVIEELHDR